MILEKTAPVEFNDADNSIVGKIDRGFLSRPLIGKHISFDGRFLHAASSDLSFIWDHLFDDDDDNNNNNNDKNNLNKNNNNLNKNNKKENNKKKNNNNIKNNNKKNNKKKGVKRITFLVNIWLNHKPVSSIPFPEKLIAKLNSRSNLLLTLSPPLHLLNSNYLNNINNNNDNIIINDKNKNNNKKNNKNENNNKNNNQSWKLSNRATISIKGNKEKMGNEKEGTGVVIGLEENGKEKEVKDECEGKLKIMNWKFRQAKKHNVVVPIPVDTLSKLDPLFDSFSFLYSRGVKAELL